MVAYVGAMRKTPTSTQFCTSTRGFRYCVSREYVHCFSPKLPLAAYPIALSRSPAPPAPTFPTGCLEARLTASLPPPARLSEPVPYLRKLPVNLGRQVPPQAFQNRLLEGRQCVYDLLEPDWDLAHLCASRGSRATPVCCIPDLAPSGLTETSVWAGSTYKHDSNILWSRRFRPRARRACSSFDEPATCIVQFRTALHGA